MRVSRMGSRTIVRELVRELMRADNEELGKIRPEIRKVILKTRFLPDEDDDDPVDAA